MARHKHADVIHAWAEGEEIEFRNMDMEDWRSTKHANLVWFEMTEYRVKPKLVKKEGWIGLYSERSTGLPYCRGVYTSEEEARELGGEGTVVKISWEQEE